MVRGRCESESERGRQERGKEARGRESARRNRILIIHSE